MSTTLANGPILSDDELAAMDAYKMAKVEAARMIQKGAIFTGAFGVARNLGLTDGTLAWDFAVQGAMSVFTEAHIIIDKECRIV